MQVPLLFLGDPLLRYDLYPVAITSDNEEEVNLSIKSRSKSEVMIENRPNPFASMTTLYVESGYDEPATIRVFDINGKMVYSRDVQLMTGANEFVVRKSELGSAGIMMYEIESKLQYSTNRMIIVE